MATTGGLAQWCGTAAGLDSCCWGTRPVPASPTAAGLPSPPASGSACEVGSRSASGTLLGGAPHRAAPRPTWEPSSTTAASKSQPVSPSTQAGLAGSCVVTSVSATAMSHAGPPGRAGRSRAVATGPMSREASTLDVCFPLPRVSSAALLP
ncbi:hypothetical protein Q9966_009192 [Columba livia]|nr:hypothetical protein Q9966_009192 [Columba livia]